ncbi:MAG: DUF721 domain-containing protein [Spirochaetia bacterium]
MDSNSLKSAGEILKALLNENQSEQAREYYRFFSAWDEIVGENLAGRARAKELKGKTLIVEVDHPGWIQLLEMRRARILHELNERFPDLQIEKIRFYVSGEQPAAQHTPEEHGRPSTEHPKTQHSTGTPSRQPAPEPPDNNKSPDDKGKDKSKEAEDTREQPESKAKLDSVLRRLGSHIKDNGKAGGKDTGK